MNLRKRNIMFTAALFMLVQMFAQGPNNSGTYYQSADGKKGSALKTALWSVIKVIRSVRMIICGTISRPPTGVATAKCGICIPVLQTILSVQTKPETIRRRVTFTTVSILSRKVGSTKHLRCTPICSISCLLTDM